MNILHIVDEPYDSGIVHYALTAARGLKDRGHAVLFAGRPGTPPLELAARLGLETLAVARLPAGAAALRRAVRERSVDVVNAHTGSSHALAVVATQGLGRAPAVVRTRGDARPVRRTPGSGLLWRRTAGFIAASSRILAEFQRAFPGLKTPSRAVPPGLADPGRRGEPGSPPLKVGIVARLDPVKGHADFLRAAARVARSVPQARFLVAGREANIRRSQLAALAERLGIAGRVEFLGHVPDALEFMRGCHVGVIASTGSEAVSRAAIEWMSVGRPVAAAAVGCLPEIVADRESGLLVPPGDPERLAGALQALLGDAALRRRLGARARERFESGFTLGRFIDDTEGLYEQAVRGLPHR